MLNQYGLSPDTRIPCLDGTSPTIEELEKAYRDKCFWVYSCDVYGNIVPALIINLQKVSRVKAISIELDTGQVISCPLNQSLLLRDGSYKEAQHLNLGESLMPLYRRIDEKTLIGYEMLSHPCTGTWQYTHRMAVDYSKSYGITRKVVHHKDFNKRNNNPDNLQIMTWEAHTELHKNQSQQLIKYSTSEQGRQRSRELMITLWGDPQWRLDRLAQNKLNGHTTIQRHGKPSQFGNGVISLEKLKDFGRAAAKRSIGVSRPREAVSKGISTIQHRLETDPAFKESMQKRATRNINGHNERLREEKIRTGVTPLSKAQLTARKQNALKLQDPVVRKRASLHTAYTRFHKNKFPTFEAYLESRETTKAPNNHKIISVSELGLLEVYAITVEGLYNFAIEQGVFVHDYKSEFDP